MFSFGNELGYSQENYQYADQLIQGLKQKDSTRLYAPGSNQGHGGINPSPNSDFHSSQHFMNEEMRGSYGGLGGFLNETPPSSAVNFDDAVKNVFGFNVPFFGFEVGQYQVFPDVLSETQKYTGVLDARNFKMVSEKINQKELSDADVADAVNASGMLSRIAYKAEIEAALRTKGMSGISLLGIQDFSGQGTALVGMMNAFGEPKPYAFANPNEFNSFFNPTVVLFESAKFTYKNSESLAGNILLSNFSLDDISEKINYKLSYKDGTVFREGETDFINFKQGELTTAAQISIPLDAITVPTQFKFEVSCLQSRNNYDIWVYPDENQIDDEEIYVTDYLDETATDLLENGGKVFLSHRALKTAFPNSRNGKFSTAFWSTYDKTQPGTMGLLLNPEHSLFEFFPTDYHSNYQWWAMARYGRPMNLEVLTDKSGKKIKPIIKVLDGFEKLENLGLLYQGATNVIKEHISFVKPKVQSVTLSDVYFYSLLLNKKLVRFMPIPTKMIRSHIAVRFDMTVFLWYTMFYDCHKRENIMKKFLSVFVVLVMVAGLGAGFSVSAKQVIDVNGFVFEDTVLVGYVGSAAHIVIPDGITEIGNDAFWDCEDILSVKIPEGVRIIGDGAFMYCESLLFIDIPNSVKIIGDQAFYRCYSLLSVDIPEGVTEIGWMAFYGCDALVSLDIPGSIRIIGDNAFEGCESLETLNINEGVESIGDWAFYWCESLMSVSIPSSVAEVGWKAFYDCFSLEEINVSADNEQYSSADGVLFDKSKETLIQYPCSKAGEAYNIPNSVVTIGESAFGTCSFLVSVDIPNSVKTISWGAFEGCALLESVSIPSGVEIIDACAFRDCVSLLSVSIPNSVVEIGDWAFAWCESLATVDIANGVTIIGTGAFCGCESLGSIDLPNNLSEIGIYAFSNCISLESINVSGDSEKYSSVDGVLFSKDKRMIIRYPEGKPGETYSIPSGVTAIDECAFDGCVLLTSVDIPEGVESIGWSAFCDCPSLAFLNIPESVVAMSGSTFDVNTTLIVKADSFAHMWAIDNQQPYLLGFSEFSDISDVFNLLKWIVSSAPLNTAQVAVADVSGEGTVDSVDALMLMKEILGLD